MECECKICGEIIWVDAEDFGDYEETLWGHIQMAHPEVFEEVQNFETPFMLEECYNASEV